MNATKRQTDVFQAVDQGVWQDITEKAQERVRAYLNELIKPETLSLWSRGFSSHPVKLMAVGSNDNRVISPVYGAVGSIIDGEVVINWPDKMPPLTANYSCRAPKRWLVRRADGIAVGGFVDLVEAIRYGWSVIADLPHWNPENTHIVHDPSSQSWPSVQWEDLLAHYTGKSLRKTE